MTDYVIMPKSDYQGACDAIRAKTGKTDLIKSGDMATEIEEIKTGGGGSSAEEKDVNFYDYDGTLLHSYTVSEAQALTELPELPTQEGLICQGWNWTLEDIKSYDCGMDVGATYITDDGKTRLYISIDQTERTSVTLCFSATPTNGVTVDWGDGSPTETTAGTHTYANTGDYIITLEPAEGCTFFLGSSDRSVIGGCSTSTTTKDISARMLKKVEIGRDAHLRSYSLYQCKTLVSITIPNGAAYGSSNKGVFYGCALLSCLILPNTLKGTGENYARDCTHLSLISIPKSVTSIGQYSFQNAYALTSIKMPSVTNIGYGILTNCEGLTSVLLSDKLTNLNESTFSGCGSLKYYKIPDTVVSIGKNAFFYNYALQSIELPDNVKSIGTGAFHGTGIRDIKIPNGVTSIGSSTFYQCMALQTVEIPDTVTSIGSDAFNNCILLSSITIPEGVPTINASTFYGCYTLTSVKLPSSVTSIKATAFSGCYWVKYYDFTLHTAVPSLANKSAFTDIPADCEIRVPSALYEEWKAATNWSTYADQIVAV